MGNTITADNAATGETVPPKPTPPASTPPPVTSSDTPAGPVQLPDDHPLVTTLATQKARIRELREKVEQMESRTQHDVSAELTAAQARIAKAEMAVTRRDIALEKRLTATDAAMLDTVTDEDAMRALADRLSGPANGNNYVPGEGDNPKPKPDDFRDFTRSIFGKHD